MNYQDFKINPKYMAIIKEVINESLRIFPCLKQSEIMYNDYDFQKRKVIINNYTDIELIYLSIFMSSLIMDTNIKSLFNEYGISIEYIIDELDINMAYYKKNIDIETIYNENFAEEMPSILYTPNNQLNTSDMIINMCNPALNDSNILNQIGYLFNSYKIWEIVLDVEQLNTIDTKKIKPRSSKVLEFKKK